MTQHWFERRTRRSLLTGGVTVLVLSLLPAALSAPAGRAASPGAAGATPYSVTKTVTRTNLVSGVAQTVDSRTVALWISDVTNLEGLQQVNVSWTGAHPTGGEDPNPNDGANIPGSSSSTPGGTALQYPMVLLECRGVDSPTAPAAQQLTPESCWTAYEWADRGAISQVASYGAFPPWRLDMYASAADRAAQVGVPSPDTILAGIIPTTTVSQIEAQNFATCEGTTYQAVYLVPFVAADGSTYYPQNTCPAFPEPAEAASLSAASQLTFPSNETWAATAANGTGSAKFDIFTANENASLGCSDTVPCSLVAIPIEGISCDLTDAGLPPEDVPSPTETVTESNGATETVQQQAESWCTASGTVPAGVNEQALGEDTVTGAYWWSASNWRNRISVPLTFAPVSSPCNAGGAGAQEIDIYGSELMTEVSAQWDPYFCSNPSLYTLKQIATGEPEARNLLAQGNVEAAYAAYDPAGTYPAPVVSAPVAITGFGIAFNVDDYGGNEVTTLRLDPRLLAKLLTESYLDSPENFTADIPTSSADYVMRNNPINLTQDPEFIALNPEFGQNLSSNNAQQFAAYENDGAATLYSLASESDVLYALTSYIMADPEAVAWLGGHPDPWGMVVNPNYKLPSSTLSLPTYSWPLLDQVTSTVGVQSALNQGNVCPQLSQTPWLDLVASPQPTLLSIAEGVEFANSFSPTRCVQINSQFNPYSPPNVVETQGAQRAGQHFMLGLVSLGEASRYNLDAASLETDVKPGTPAGQFAPATARTFVAPTTASLRAAAGLIAADATTQTWQVPAGVIQSTPADSGAYPGTMVVDAQIPTSGLPRTDATNLSKFLQFAAGQGQTPGTGYGTLPAGYLPMTAANGLGDLVAYTQAAAAAVEAQQGAIPALKGGPPPGSGGSSSPSPGSSAGSSSPKGSSNPSPSSSPRGTGTTGSTGSGPGSTSALKRSSGPGLGGAQPSVNGGVTGPVAAISKLFGKTLGVISDVAGSLVRWLMYLAMLALAAAGVVYLIGRRRGLDLRGLLAVVRELVGGRFARRRAP